MHKIAIESLKCSKMDILLWVDVSVMLWSDKNSFQRENLLLSPSRKAGGNSSSNRVDSRKVKIVISGE